ncbi:MAG TPA: FkbM family methyltransferase [Nitrososphaeraceae archaeon]|nr:FkbM family methyltransferase [Nitrososphaeraceae archaeon]
MPNYPVGSGAWLRQLRGAKLHDKCVLFSLKIIYLGIRGILKLFLGRKKTDKFCLKHGINFRDFLYRSVEFLRLDNSLLVVFSSPKYGYQFYSRITRKVNNFLVHDMYTSMVTHEDEIVEQFSPKIGDIVIDVGAAFGFYTILASKRVGQQGKVVAIEPQPDSFEMLNRNIRLNKLANTRTLNYAVSSKKTTLKLYSTYSVIQERARQNLQSYIEVRADTLDDLLRRVGIDRVNWIKIDVEGAEYEVLTGAKEILYASKPISILVEIHGKDTYEPVIELLKSNNFNIEFEKTYDNGEKHVLARKMPYPQG